MIRTTAFLGLFTLSILRCSAQPGMLDSTFGVNGKVTTGIGTDDDIAHEVAIQADGKLVVAGWSRTGTDDDMSLVRYNIDGSLDTTFGTNGKVITVVGLYGSQIEALAIQPDGKIVVAGFAYSLSYSDFALVRYNTDGTPDSTFGTNGKVIAYMGSSSDAVYDIVIQPDGKIVAVGTHNSSSTGTHFALARFNANGSFDTTFGTNGKVYTTFGLGSEARSVLLQPDGKIVVGGEVYVTSSDADFGLARYNMDGSLDTTFGGTGLVTTPVSGNFDAAESIALQPDGKIVTAGSSGFGVNRRMTVVRNHPDGSVDSTFGVNGRVVTSFGNNLDVRGRDLFLQPDGKVVVCGGVSFTSTTESFAVARYKTNGSLDSTFGISGKVTTAMSTYTAFGFSTLLQPDGKIVVAGDVYNGADDDFAVARYHGDQVGNVNATRCGRIWTECVGGNTRAIHLEIHTNGIPVSTDSLYIDYGDATMQAVCVTAFTQCDTFPGYCVLFFDFMHTYSPGNYSMVVTCGKHLPGIGNIPNSANVDFCLLTEMVIDPNIGCNSSPVSDSLNLEVNWLTGQMNVVGMHVWDPEVDSISWNLVPPTCLQLGYIAPQVAGGGSFSFSQPAETVSWNMPTTTGLYTAVFLFEEWRTTPTTVIVGVTTREVLIDMDNGLAVTEQVEQEPVMYPNPASQTITLVAEQGEYVTIYDLSGRAVLSQQLGAGENTIDVSFLAAGAYCVQRGAYSEKLIIAR